MVTRDPIDEALVEIDLLAVAEAVGVYRGGPVELGPDDPAVPDTAAQRARRRQMAARRARHVDTVRRNATAFDHQVGRTRPNLDSEAACRGHGNRLAALGFDINYIARRLGINTRSTK